MHNPTCLKNNKTHNKFINQYVFSPLGANEDIHILNFKVTAKFKNL